MKKNINKIVIATALFASVAVPAVTFAQTTTGSSTSYVLLTPLPCVGVTNGGNSGTTCVTTNGTSEITSIGLQSYLIYLFKLLIALAVFLAVVMTIVGGFQYMTTEAITGKTAARATIEHAVEGLLLALASYLILYTINPNFVNISKVAVPKLNLQVTSINPNVTVDGAGKCHAAGQIATRANIVPCPPGIGIQTATSTRYNTNPDGTRVLPAPGTNICTTHGYNSRTHQTTTHTYPCDSNGNAL